MSGPAELLRQVPAEFTLAASLAIGSIILVCLVLFHGMGIHWIGSFHKRGARRLREGRPHIIGALFLFGAAVFLLLTLHVIGVLGWSAALIHLGLIRTAKDAIYFCANAYTTLGYGQVDLDPQYRIISPIIGISGLFTFAWTTSALVNIVGGHEKLLETLQNERAKERELRRNLTRSVLDAHASEREAERAAGVKFAGEVTGTSLYGHWQLWREERRQIKALRRGLRSDITSQFREERIAETNLGAPPANPDAPASGSPAPSQPAANSAPQSDAKPTTKPTPPPKP